MAATSTAMLAFNSLGARHQELVAAIIKNLGNADINWDAVASDANFSSAKYARDEYRKVRKTLGASDANGAATPSSTAVKKKATPKKRKNDDEESPSKKKAKGTKGTTSSEDGVKDDSEDTVGLIKAEDESEDGHLV